jgi:hypothetical protein
MYDVVKFGDVEKIIKKPTTKKIRLLDEEDIFDSMYN